MSHYQYVPARTNHLLHLILTFCTFGFWLPVWFVIALRNHGRTVTKLLPMPPAAPVSFQAHTWPGAQPLPRGADYGALDRQQPPTDNPRYEYRGDYLPTPLHRVRGNEVQYGSAHWDQPRQTLPTLPPQDR